MQDLVLGYTYSTWADIYRLFVWDNEVEPKDLYKLRMYWQTQAVRTPDECIKVVARLVRCSENDSSKVFEMLNEFVRKVGQV